MAIYEPKSAISGKWAKASELGGVKSAKIISETKPSPSQFKDEKTGAEKMQDVAKVQFQGMSDPLNVNLNRATIAGLISAFGKDSNDWVGHTLSVETEKMRVAGKAVVALYLIPAGYKRIDDDNGYALIVPKDEPESVPSISLDEEETSVDVPF